MHPLRQTPVSAVPARNSNGCMGLSAGRGSKEAGFIRTSTRKDYVIARLPVNFAETEGNIQAQIASKPVKKSKSVVHNQRRPKSFLTIYLKEFDQAACGAGSSSEPFTGAKYRSKVLIAASKTMWQSEQESKCRLISVATGGESRPSKYQQIKWIVSRQLMTAVPP